MTDHPVPFTPGFPGDWPVRPANFLQLDWQAHTRNFIHIWLPEGVAIPGGDAVFILREVVDFRFTLPEPELWVVSYEKSGVIALRGECRAITEGVALALAITNLSETAWEETRPGVCVQLAAAPDFADPALERTVSVTDGRLCPMAPPEHVGLTAHYHPSAPPTENFIAVASRLPGFVIAQWWEGPPISVGGNSHPSIACLHAQPAFGRIAPGETVRREGRLYLMPGTVEEAYQRYVAEKRRHEA